MFYVNRQAAERAVHVYVFNPVVRKKQFNDSKARRVSRKNGCKLFNLLLREIIFSDFSQVSYEFDADVIEKLPHLCLVAQFQFNGSSLFQRAPRVIKNRIFFFCQLEFWRHQEINRSHFSGQFENFNRSAADGIFVYYFSRRGLGHEFCKHEVWPCQRMENFPVDRTVAGMIARQGIRNFLYQFGFFQNLF